MSSFRPAPISLSSHQARSRPCACRHLAPFRSSAAAASPSPNVVIQVEGPDGSNRGSFEAESGEILRVSLLKEKHELYQGWAKITNCNGGGTCGTCLVEVEDPSSIASERTATEIKKLKGKKETMRLACQTCIGDGDNSGSVKIKLGPK